MKLYPALRAGLFRVPAERMHHASVAALERLGRHPLAAAAVRRRLAPPPRPVQTLGLTFDNPIGMAAGFDKEASAFRGLAAFGFGHVEVGTITPRPQPGNPGPRLFRLPADRALINRLGFPSSGAKAAADRLRGPRPPGLVVGVNLGKNKDTPLEAAHEDYLALLTRFAPLADYLAINISSPNTVGLRRLQARATLDDLVGTLMSAHGALAHAPPLLVKLSPDLPDDALDDALDVLLSRGVHGVIATNTTTARPATLQSATRTQTGGLSGAPLADRATAVVAAIHRRTQGRLPIIGVGGVFTAADAQAKLDAGATLVQLYTGFIYEGPRTVRRIVEGLTTS